MTNCGTSRIPKLTVTEMEDEGSIYFVGPCTCDHDLDQHGWGKCDVKNCQCEAGWEE
jgi:hypothetical protein